MDINATIDESSSSSSFFTHICNQYFYSSEWLTFSVCLYVTVQLTFWSLNAFLFFIEYNDIPWIDVYRIQKHKPKLRLQPDVVQLLKKGVIQHQIGIILILPLLYLLLNLYGHLSVSAPIPPISTIVWQIIVSILVDDFVFFWTHYLFHTRWLYEHIHKKHHVFKQPTGVAAVVSDPIEALIQNQLGIWLAFIVFQEKHLFTICLWTWIRTSEGVSGHSGYQFPYVTMYYYMPWLATSTSQHDYHHQYGRMNYGSFFTIWDRLMNTYRLPKHE